MSAKMNLTRYRTFGKLPQNFYPLFEPAVRSHVAVPIKPDGTDERAIGWCEHGDELNLHPTWSYGGAVVLDLRIETLKVPSKELKRAVRVRRQELERERGEQLGKSALMELKDLIKADFRKKLPPKIATVPMLWDVDRQRVYVGSQNQSVLESFLKLFANTFKMALDIEGPEAWRRERFGSECGGRLLGEPRLEAAQAAENDEADEAPSAAMSFDQDFLTWLFYEAREPLSGSWATLKSFILQVGDKVRLRSGEAQVIADSDLDTARRLLADNYSVRELPIILTTNERVWSGMLSSDLQWRGVSLPAILSEGVEEETLERIDLLATLDGILKSTYERYLDVRGDEDRWIAVQASIQNWARADRTK